MAVVYLIDEKISAVTATIDAVTARMTDMRIGDADTKRELAEETAELQRLRRERTPAYVARVTELTEQMSSHQDRISQLNELIAGHMRRVDENSQRIQVLSQSLSNTTESPPPEVVEEMRQREDELMRINEEITPLSNEFMERSATLQSLTEQLAMMTLDEQIRVKEEQIMSYKQSLEASVEEQTRLKTELDTQTKERRSIVAMKEAHLKREKEILDRLTALESAVRRVPASTSVKPSR